jgi:WD40 repeat protein
MSSLSEEVNAMSISSNTSLESSELVPESLKESTSIEPFDVDLEGKKAESKNENNNVQFRTIKGHKGAVNCVIDVSSSIINTNNTTGNTIDNNALGLFITGGEDGTIRVWDDRLGEGEEESNSKSNRTHQTKPVMAMLGKQEITAISIVGEEGQVRQW